MVLPMTADVILGPCKGIIVSTLDTLVKLLKESVLKLPLATISKLAYTLFFLHLCFSKALLIKSYYYIVRLESSLETNTAETVRRLID